MKSTTLPHPYPTRLLLGAILSAVGILLTAPTAAATVDGDYQEAGARIMVEPNGYSGIVGSGYPGQRVTMICGTYGPWSPDSGTVNFWILHRNITTGVVGYTSGGNVAFWTRTTLPDC